MQKTKLDLISFSLLRASRHNPLESVSKLRDPIGVMASGRWLDKRQFQQMSEDRAISYGR